MKIKKDTIRAANIAASTQTNSIARQDSPASARPLTPAQPPKTGNVDPNALVQQVMRQSYLQSTEDLKFFAEKVKYFNSTKKEMRDYLAKMGAVDASVLQSIDNLTPNTMNIVETLMHVFKESIRASNEDKKFYLNKLQSLNKVAEDIAAYQQKVSDASARLGTQESSDKKKDDD